MTADATSAIWHFDRPGFRPVADVFVLEGWVAADAEVTALEPQLGVFSRFEWVGRPDLIPPPGGRRWARGFRARARRTLLAGDGAFSCRVSVAGRGDEELHWNFPAAVDPERKRRKLAAIRPLLDPAASPRECGDFLSFLPGIEPVEEPELVSGFGYPEDVDALIARHRDGWILDCGAGNRPVYHDNVVNLEVAPFPSTDILADAERLPFRDNTFDGVVTLAVLEHVRRPWAVAAELVRVLKPGGTLIADVPFLQPRHAYPHHYYNMTSEGLRALFEDGCEVVSAGVPHYGRPIYTLAWILQRYAAGLPEADRQAFLRMSVAELAAPAAEQASAPHVANLEKPVAFELASVTSLTARKR